MNITSHHNVENPITDDLDVDSGILRGLSDLPPQNNKVMSSGFQINSLIVPSENQSKKLTRNPFYHVGQTTESLSMLSRDSSSVLSITNDKKIEKTESKAQLGSNDSMTIEKLDDPVPVSTKSKNPKTSALRELTQVPILRPRSRMNEGTLRNPELNVTFNSNPVELTRLENLGIVHLSRRTSQEAPEYILSQLQNESLSVAERVNPRQPPTDQKNELSAQVIAENPEPIATENATTRVLKETVTETDKREENKLDGDNERRERSCRVCLEEEEGPTIGKFVNACQCSGTMGLIHDECLKTWLVSKGMDAEGASCELCKAKFHMTFDEKLRFYPKQACKDGVGSLLSCICLSIIISGLTAVIVLIVVNWNNSNSTSDNPIQQNSLSFKVVVVTICGFIVIMLSVLAFVSCREAFFIHELANWSILDWTPEWQREQDELDAREAEAERPLSRQQSLSRGSSNRRGDRRPASRSNSVVPMSDNSDRHTQPIIRLNQQASSMTEEQSSSRVGINGLTDRNSSQPQIRTNEAERISDFSVNESRLDRTQDELLHNLTGRASNQFAPMRRQQRNHQVEERKGEELHGSSQDERSRVDNDEEEIDRVQDLLNQHKSADNDEIQALEERKEGLSDRAGRLVDYKARSRPQTPHETKTLRVDGHQNSMPRLLQSISPKFLQGGNGDHIVFEVRVDTQKKDFNIENIMDSQGNTLLEQA